jgi:hypothetical protein
MTIAISKYEQKPVFVKDLLNAGIWTLEQGELDEDYFI